MHKETRTTYTFDQPGGTTITWHLDGDFLVFTYLWANGEVETEIRFHATVGALTDLSTVVNEMLNEVIGE